MEADIILACDGGCPRNGKTDSIGGWGVLIQYKGASVELRGSEHGVTSQQMEMKALLNGLRAIESKHLSVEVISDSAYVINCFNKRWYENWERNGWRAYSGDPVKNIPIWKELLIEVRMFNHIKFTHVRGHRGHPLNERVDELATQAIYEAILQL